MIKRIVVPSTGHECDTVAFAAAATIARCFAAHIDAVHVRIDPVAIAAAMSTEGAGGTLLQGLIDSLSNDADDTAAKARAQFSAFCEREGLMLVSDPPPTPRLPSAVLHVETGEAAAWLATYGLTSDLAVASRGMAGHVAAERAVLEALLIETGRPLLIPGPEAPGGDFADYVTVAWKPAPQVARAVAQAMPFLKHAREVVVLTVGDEGGPDHGRRLAEYLAWHGIKAAAQHLSHGADTAAATMLKAAVEHGGLLVMGGYGHTRLREWVFGGFTEHVLDHAELPVLMAH
jgi:nucleotide-binding universal stress UspA family protein